MLYSHAAAARRLASCGSENTATEDERSQLQVSNRVIAARLPDCPLGSEDSLIRLREFPVRCHGKIWL